MDLLTPAEVRAAEDLPPDTRPVRTLGARLRAIWQKFVRRFLGAPADPVEPSAIQKAWMSAYQGTDAGVTVAPEKDNSPVLIEILDELRALRSSVDRYLCAKSSIRVLGSSESPDTAGESLSSEQAFDRELRLLKSEIAAANRPQGE